MHQDPSSKLRSTALSDNPCTRGALSEGGERVRRTDCRKASKAEQLGHGVPSVQAHLTTLPRAAVFAQYGCAAAQTYKLPLGAYPGCCGRHAQHVHPLL
jgi:hypothetical protein